MYKFVIGYSNLAQYRQDIDLSVVECKFNCHITAAAIYLNKVYDYLPDYCRRMELWLLNTTDFNYNLHTFLSEFLDDEESLSVLKIST